MLGARQEHVRSTCNSALLGDVALVGVHWSVPLAPHPFSRGHCERHRAEASSTPPPPSPAPAAVSSARRRHPQELSAILYLQLPN